MFTVEQLSAVVRNVLSGARARRERTRARRALRDLRAECERLEERRLFNGSANEYQPGHSYPYGGYV